MRRIFFKDAIEGKLIYWSEKKNSTHKMKIIFPNHTRKGEIFNYTKKKKNITMCNFIGCFIL